MKKVAEEIETQKADRELATVWNWGKEEEGPSETSCNKDGCYILHHTRRSSQAAHLDTAQELATCTSIATAGQTNITDFIPHTLGKGSPAE